MERRRGRSGCGCVVWVLMGRSRCGQAVQLRGGDHLRGRGSGRHAAGRDVHTLIGLARLWRVATEREGCHVSTVGCGVWHGRGQSVWRWAAAAQGGVPAVIRSIVHKKPRTRRVRMGHSIPLV
jgi:hypothetical protein